MKNLWISWEHPFAAWVADLSAASSLKDALFQFTLQVIRAGEATQVFRLLAAPLIGYQREQNGDLTAFLTQRYQASGQVDLFHLTDAAMAPHAPHSSQSCAYLRWYDAQGIPVEGWLDEPGQILRQQDPNDEQIPPGFKQRYPPVRVVGALVNGGGHQPVQLRIELHSDIWFPWVYGAAHPKHDYKRMFDNRLLAHFHTPRLNRFLAEVRQQTLSFGGDWRLDQEESALNHLFLLADTGVQLDIDPPGGPMPVDLLDIPWV